MKRLLRGVKWFVIFHVGTILFAGVTRGVIDCLIYTFFLYRNLGDLSATTVDYIVLNTGSFEPWQSYQMGALLGLLFAVVAFVVGVISKGNRQQPQAE